MDNSTNLTDSQTAAIGHEYQAEAILSDPELCPHFSDEGRRDIANGLRLLAIMERCRPGDRPWDAVVEECAKLKRELAEALEKLAEARRTISGCIPTDERAYGGYDWQRNIFK